MVTKLINLRHIWHVIKNGKTFLFFYWQKVPFLKKSWKVFDQGEVWGLKLVLMINSHLRWRILFICSQKYHFAHLIWNEVTHAFLLPVDISKKVGPKTSNRNNRYNYVYLNGQLTLFMLVEFHNLGQIKLLNRSGSQLIFHAFLIILLCHCLGSICYLSCYYLCYQIPYVLSKTTKPFVNSNVNRDLYC